MSNPFGWFTGADARSDINKGYKKATNALEKGHVAQDQGYDQAFNTVNPFITGGTKAYNTYDAMLGLAGPGEQKYAYDMMMSNPLYRNALDQQNNSLLRYLNSRGNTGGAADIAAQIAFQRNTDNWMNRYRDQGAQGFQAAQFGSGIQTGKADNNMGYQASRANLDTQRASAIGNTRNTAMNNIIGLTGALTGAGTAYSNYTTNNALQNYFARQQGPNPWQTIVDRTG